METKANYALVGFFTVLVMAAAFGFVYWMSIYGREGPTADLIIKIPGSANGLSVGSQVSFNGIQIGSIRALEIDRKDPRFSTAMASIRADAPVFADTEVVLEVQGLTGAAYVEMNGGVSSGDTLLQKAEKEGKTATITARQSSVTNLLATADKIMSRADSVVQDVQKFTSASRDPLTKTVQNAESFSEALASNKDGIDQFLKSVSALSGTINGLSTKLDSTLSAVDDLLKPENRAKVESVLSNADTVSKNVALATADLKGTVDRVNKAVETYEKVGQSAAASLDRIDKILASVDPAKVGTAMDDIASATKDARSAIADFKGIADDVSKRRTDIDKAIANFTQLSDTLKTASTKIDGILTKVDTMLGSQDSNGMFAQAKETLASFKQVADTLNAKIGPIADNLARFSGGGLRDVKALVDDTRRTMKNLDETISNFDKDPQRLLFGGESVKQYDGRTRH